jgi:hypothetical protein
MQTKSVSPFQIYARLTVRMETVLHASKDMTSNKENVSFLIPTTPSLLTLDAAHGLGTSKSA